MTRSGLLAIACLFGVHSAWGHHGIANFDLNRDVAFSGVIREIAFVNPHSWLYVDVQENDGQITRWKCELRGATVLRRSGWSKDMFQPGTAVSLAGAPDRFADNTCYMGSITFADGMTMDRYGQLGQTEVAASTGIKRMPDGKPDFSGDWAAEQRVMTDPTGISGALLPISIADNLGRGEVPTGAMAFPGARGTPESFAENPIETAWSRPSPVQLTRAGENAVADFDPSSTDNPRLRCEPTNILFDWGFETVPNRIEQQQDHIRIVYGAMGLERTIRFSDRFPTVFAPSRSGYSIGSWEGDTLVVKTRGFLPGILSADTSTPHSDTLVITERFTLAQDGSALQREYVAEDALYFEGQFRGRDVVYPSNIPWEPFSCDERSYRSDIQ